MGSATKKAIDERSWALFVDDAAAATTDIEEGLLALEQNPEDEEQLNALFRGLHTLKGSSGFVGLVALNALAHEAEELVGLARDKELTLDAAMIDVLLGTLDMIRLIIDESANGPVERHDGLIEPLCQQLSQLSNANGEERASCEGLRKLSETLGATLDECREACEAGGAGLPDEVTRLAQKAQSTGETLGLPSYAAHTASLLDALVAGQTRSLRLHWHLAHVKVEEAADGSLVFIDDGFDATPAGDDEAVRVFLECATQLLSPLVHGLQRLSDPEARSELGAVIAELAAACTAMEYTHLVNVLSILDEESQRPEDNDAQHVAKRFIAALVDLQEEWVIRTGFSPPEGFDIAAQASRLWEGHTQPYRLVVPKAPPTPRRDDPQQAANAPVRAPAAAPVRATNQGQGTKFLRIEAAKVEQLMALAGELGLAVGAVFNHPEVAALEREDLRSNVERVEGLIRELQDTSAGLALVPISTVFGRMNRLARDLARQTGKKFTLVTRGGDTEIDKTWVDALVDPLIHLVRNAADHGIETPAQRRAAGKPETARIVLSAQHHGDNVAIRLEDDGAGMNRDAILRRALERGLVAEDDTEQMADADVWDLVFEPGFSTTETVSSISGRGMGMDVVRATVQAHRGHVSVSSREGKGTCITLQVPLTLAFLDGMVIRIGRWLYVLPVTSVTRVFRVEESDFVRVKSGSTDLVRVGEELVPCVELEAFFSGSEPQNVVGRLVVVVHTARGEMAIPIDELVGQEQVTMNPLSGFLREIRGGAACGLLRTGEVAIALDCERLHGHAL